MMMKVGVPALLVAMLALLGSGLISAPSQGGQSDGSPHAEALALVLARDPEFIASLESDHVAWWHDTKRRDWQVIRPFAPGLLDSTHTFIVVYSVDGSERAQWNVDTRARQVKRVEHPNQ